MSNDIMVDLETLDTRASSIILSIGACRVDWNNNEVSDPFYRVINIESCRAIGLTESASTRAWWDRQSEEAKSIFTDPCIDIQDALIDFANYLRPFDHKKVRIWGNGSDFDNTILIHAYDALGLDAPWRFYNNRCFRTVKSIMSHLIMDIKREGTYHNALDDAKHQARMLLQLRDYIPR